jgi:metal-responsive CopG/Arc/MetJ family transcriptional regulator
VHDPIGWSGSGTQSPGHVGRFGELIAGTGSANRSEATRDLVRNRLVDEAWQAVSGEMNGTLSITISTNWARP